jgi:hypothetical protein
MNFLSFSRWVDPVTAKGLKEGKKTPRERLSYPTPDSDRSYDGKFWKKLANASRQFAASTEQTGEEIFGVTLLGEMVIFRSYHVGVPAKLGSHDSAFVELFPTAKRNPD